LLKFIRVILSPLTILYKIVIDIRNKLFDKNIFKQEKVAAKIISVGNLTVGGSGKTPLVILIAKYLKNNNNRVGVLSRGYGRTTHGYQLISKDNNPLLTVDKAGDEIYLVAKECNVPTAVCEKRVDGAKKFLADIDLDTIVLDDGFQHRWIKRDLDVLIIDQKFLSNVNNVDQSLLPMGSMRESFKSIDRADLVVVNRKFSPKINVPTKLKNFFINKNVLYSYYKVEGVFDIKNNKHYSIEEFEGQHSLVVCGIAQPFSFLRSLEGNNININNKLLFPDHKNYTLKEVEKIRKEFYDTNSYSVLTTQKDAAKLIQFKKELDDIDIYYLKINTVFEEPNDFYKIINDKVLIK